EQRCRRIKELLQLVRCQKELLRKSINDVPGRRVVRPFDMSEHPYSKPEEWHTTSAVLLQLLAERVDIGCLPAPLVCFLLVEKRVGDVASCACTLRARMRILGLQPSSITV